MRFVLHIEDVGDLVLGFYLELVGVGLHLFDDLLTVVTADDFTVRPHF